ncbi:Glucan endo-1,3-alpha-glucosidase Agn1 [Taphrina deformans PYCC 5710]|uniref:Glucan endo-1,3-alpha-glucosidase Agn1 n=1 Tax=Taphrina deformans (strain PYCC 5710 / ATCC 11124 / CBS 356.35 / IMI 108563 / JCM 9778 / NBRC 8474) TaxID=1097556 RepID=R4X9M0_TAPDE|nr:Glucan endo-1,3-alpha-glucosidase Agn1 [Taphrina deformans PYCC 5710]|eukprot:CCG82461.1 Glucan endo-1,3-alpha-glucosidase Agn1 [Taphrina deformans PYCC 5710]
MYVNPAAVVAFFAGFLPSSPSSEGIDGAIVGHVASPTTDLIRDQESLSTRSRNLKHRHDHLKKRAITIWQTQTVQYTVPPAKAYTPTTTSTPSSTQSTSATTLATSYAGNVATAATQAKSTTAAAAATTAATINSGSGPKKVFAHFMMGNSYPMSVSDFAADIAAASAVGIDGFALNVGPDSWMADRVAKMYSAAVGTSFKLFISLDMAVMAGDGISDLTSWVTNYASHPNQYFYNNKQFVSTFAGESVTFGYASAASGWSAFKNTLSAAGHDIFFVPSFTALGPSAAMGMSSNDGAFSWDAWSTTNSEMSTAEDTAYMSNKGSKVYMAGISPWFYTHFSYKNWIYKSDDLYTTRWEQLVSMQPDFIEIITWNDFGESSYIGPLTGATPYDSEINSSAWVNGHDHTAWTDLAAYYIQAYKNAAYPTVTSNKLFWWYRTHSKDASATSDPYGKPTNYGYADDNIYLSVLLTGSATVTVTSGGSSQTFNGVAGMNHFQYLGFSTGTPSVSITMGGSQVLSVSGPAAIVSSPSIYNFNPVVSSSSF